VAEPFVPAIANIAPCTEICEILRSDSPELVNINEAVTDEFTTTFPNSWLEAEIASSGPEIPVVPVNGTGSDSAESESPSRVSMPFVLPGRVPWNQIVKLLFCPGCIFNGKCSPEIENSLPVRLALVNVTAVSPLLATIAMCDTFLPTPVLPKSIAPGTT
jgi:hypothetical protein